LGSNFLPWSSRWSLFLLAAAAERAIGRADTL